MEEKASVNLHCLLFFDADDCQCCAGKNDEDDDIEHLVVENTGETIKVIILRVFVSLSLRLYIGLLLDDIVAVIILNVLITDVKISAEVLEVLQITLRVLNLWIAFDDGREIALPEAAAAGVLFDKYFLVLPVKQNLVPLHPGPTKVHPVCRQGRKSVAKHCGVIHLWVIVQIALRVPFVVLLAVHFKLNNRKLGKELA